MFGRTADQVRHQQVVATIAAPGQRHHSRALARGFIQPALQTPALVFIDDVAVVGVGGQIGIMSAHPSARFFDKGRVQRLGQQHIIGRNAGLAGVYPFAAHHPRHRLIQIGIFQNQRGRFAAQFQRERGEVGSRRLHHQAADGGGAGEKQMVKRQRGKSRSHIRAALHNGQLIGGKIVRHGIGQPAAERGRMLRGFYHGAVAGGKGADQRADAEKKRIIPRRNHAHHAHRLRHNAVFRRPERPRHRRLARPHPALAVAQRMADALERGHHFQQIGFVAAAPAEIGADGGLYGFAVRVQHIGKLLQTLLPQRPRHFDMAARSLVKQLETIGQIGRFHKHSLGGIWLMAASASAVMVRLGFTPRLAEILAPSIT